MNDLGFIKDAAELRKLIAENPDLPIVVMAGETAAPDVYQQWAYCANVECVVDDLLDCEVPFSEYTYSDESSFEDDLRDYLYDLPENEGLSDEEFDKLLKSEMEKYEPYWKRVIAIYVDN